MACSEGWAIGHISRLGPPNMSSTPSIENRQSSVDTVRRIVDVSFNVRVHNSTKLLEQKRFFWIVSRMNVPAVKIQLSVTQTPDLYIYKLEAHLRPECHYDPSAGIRTSVKLWFAESVKMSLQEIDAVEILKISGDLGLETAMSSMNM